MNFFYNIDVSLFYFINVTLANPVTDFLMPFITERNHWMIFFVIMWFVMVIKGGKRGRIAAVLIIICVVISDQTSSVLIKNIFDRVRPCNVLPGVHLLIPCSSSYSFPSSHAVNHFAGSYLLSHFYPEYKIGLYIGSFLIAISRVFVGVHYPSDVAGGILIGLLIGFIVVQIWLLINKVLKIKYKRA
ncbi:MAG: phosphatase PAP2 family protein [Ignavibacteria bacterium]|nr:phosphatase PAP2 family protein [Ignavibacteria bacterium]